MRLAVVGPGLIGRSVALAARRADPATDIVEIDQGESLEPAAAADLVVLACPVDAILDIVRHHSHVLRESVTIDTGSTKRVIVRAARDAGLRRFVGGHPMAGGTGRGPHAARADLFDGCLWLLIPHEADAAAAGLARDFVTRLGARAVVLDDEGSEHDRVMAAVSHLPQVVASALLTVVADAAGERLGWAGAGLRDTTRLAASSVAIWNSILATNAQELRPLLLTLAEQLARLAHRLDDPETVRDLFVRANTARAALDGRR